MKVCFVGNSHLGAIKQAYDEDFARRDLPVEVVFWGVPGKHFRYPNLRYEDGNLVSPFPYFSGRVSGGSTRSSCRPGHSTRSSSTAAACASPAPPNW